MYHHHHHHRQLYTTVSLELTKESLSGTLFDINGLACYDTLKGY